MRFASRWLALCALVLGAAAAVAFAEDDGPLAPKSLRLTAMGEGAAISYDGVQWQSEIGGLHMLGLDLVRATYVRGPARVRVVAATFVDVPKGSVARVSWEPSVRGWRFVAVTGEFNAYFANTSAIIPEGQSITLTSGGELYTAPNGYAPSRVIGLVGLPEVSGFRPFEDDVR